jgi:PAS domain S-box-containing protein
MTLALHLLDPILLLAFIFVAVGLAVGALAWQSIYDQLTTRAAALLAVALAAAGLYVMADHYDQPNLAIALATLAGLAGLATLFTLGQVYWAASRRFTLLDLEKQNAALEARVAERTRDAENANVALSQTNDQLLASELRYRRLADHTPVLIWSAEPNGSVNFYSQYWADYTGGTDMESRGQGWAPFIHPDDLETVKTKWGASISSGKDLYLEHRIRRYDGEYRWHLGRGRAARNEKGEIVGWYGTTTEIHDEITSREERQRLMQQLRDSQETLTDLIDSMPQLAWMANAKGRVTFYNRQSIQYTGIDLLHAEQFSDAIHPEDSPESTAAWRKSIQTGEPYFAKYRLRDQSSGQYRWFLARGNPLPDDDGNILKWFGTATDIHEQKVTEEALHRANTDLQHFAYAASHDLQEPLRAISLQSELLLRKTGGKLNEEERQLAQEIRTSARRMSQLVKDLRIFVQTGSGRADQVERSVELTSAHEIFDAVRRDLRAAIEDSSGQVESENLAALNINPQHLYQLLANLVGNGLKYGRPGVAPLVRVRMEETTDGWLFSVTDNGSGIPAEFQHRVFEAFRRLHRHSVSGSGLGLAICARLVELYKGRIWIDETSEQGTTFCFSIQRPTINMAR